jgi:hypothetical protein
MQKKGFPESYDRAQLLSKIFRQPSSQRDAADRDAQHNLVSAIGPAHCGKRAEDYRDAVSQWISFDPPAAFTGLTGRDRNLDSSFKRSNDAAPPFAITRRARLVSKLSIRRVKISPSLVFRSNPNTNSRAIGSITSVREPPATC